MMAFTMIILFSAGFLFLYEFYRLIKRSTCRRVIILRGLPGSGKMTSVREYINNHTDEMIWCVSDYDLFTDNAGNFEWDNERADEARSHCFANFMEAINMDYDTIFVNNINSQLWEYDNYSTLARQRGYDVEIWTFPCSDMSQASYYQSRNNYGVPLSYVRKLFHLWEDDPNEELMPVYDTRSTRNRSNTRSNRHIRFPCDKRTEAECHKELDEQLKQYWSKDPTVA